jgi:hypothetical protein
MGLNRSKHSELLSMTLLLLHHPLMSTPDTLPTEITLIVLDYVIYHMTLGSIRWHLT